MCKPRARPLQCSYNILTHVYFKLFCYFTIIQITVSHACEENFMTVIFKTENFLSNNDNNEFYHVCQA